MSEIMILMITVREYLYFRIRAWTKPQIIQHANIQIGRCGSEKFSDSII